MIAIRLAEKNLPVRRDVHAPRVAALGAKLFDGAAVGTKPDYAIADGAEMFFAVARINITAAVADCRVNPAVKAPAKIVDDRVGVVGPKPSEQNHLGVRLARAFGIPQPVNVRRLGNNHPVAVKHHARDQIESLVKNRFFVHSAITLGVLQDGDSVARRL